MFDAYRDETAHFIRQPLAKVTEGKDQLIAGIITSARMLTGQRGRMMIATIDDGSAAIEVTLYSEVYEPNRSWLKEDELLVAKVNITPDKFSGGVRIVSEAVMDITGARMRFARNLHLSIDSAIDLKFLRSQIGPYLMSNRVRDPKLGPAPVAMAGSNDGMKGLMLTAAVTTSGGACLMQFPEELRIYPDDACLHSLNQILAARQSNTVQVQYQ
jgi:DNA polymerase-3 subunit alpha